MSDSACWQLVMLDEGTCYCNAGDPGWLFLRFPNILLIPGTSSTEHLRESLAAGMLNITEDVLATLDDTGPVTGQS